MPTFSTEYLLQDVQYPDAVSAKTTSRPAIIHVVTMQAVLDYCGGNMDQSAYLSRWFQHNKVATFSTWEESAPMPDPVVVGDTALAADHIFLPTTLRRGKERRLHLDQLAPRRAVLHEILDARGQGLCSL